MSADVFEFPPSDTLTPEQALNSALGVELTDVIIAGYKPDGTLFFRTSRMSRKDALWLAEKMREHALYG